MALAIQFYGIREDVINTVGPFIGKAKVARAYDAAMAEIRRQAETGARTGVNKEIPTIEKKVRAEATLAAREGVTPLVVGSFAAAGIAGALAIAAIIVSVSRSKKG